MADGIGEAEKACITALGVVQASNLKDEFDLQEWKTLTNALGRASPKFSTAIRRMSHFKDAAMHAAGIYAKLAFRASSTRADADNYRADASKYFNLSKDEINERIDGVQSENGANAAIAAEPRAAVEPRGTESTEMALRAAKDDTLEAFIRMVVTLARRNCPSCWRHECSCMATLTTMMPLPPTTLLDK